MKFLHIIKPRIAKKAGLQFYVSHKLCKNGHFCERYVSARKCVECARIYEIENQEKLSEQRAAYWYKNKEHLSAKGKEYYEKNKDRIKIVTRIYIEANREKIRASKRRYETENKEKVNAWKRSYRKRNPGKDAVNVQNRRAKLKNAGGKIKTAEVLELYEKQKGRCALCGIRISKSGKNKYNMDHIIPLVKGGSNWISNIQLTCRPCNQSKGPLDPIEFAQKNGKLL